MPDSGHTNYHRRSIRIQGYDYSSEGAYFVTITTFNRLHTIGEVTNESMLLNSYGKIALEQWVRLQKRFIPSDFATFIIMPNHVHGIIHIVRGAGEGSEHPTPRRGVGDESDQPASGIPPLRPHNPPNLGRGARNGSDHPISRRGVGDESDQPASGNPTLRPYPIPNIIPGSLGAIVRAYKASVAFRINAIRGYTTPSIWQRNYYEHIIRNEKEYQQIKDYIDTNPATWTDDRFYLTGNSV